MKNNVELNYLFDYDNLKIYQMKDAFKFSLDSILLYEFMDIKRSDKNIIDLCSGNGVIPILIAANNNKFVYGIEIQKEIYDLGILSISYNNLESKIELINDDVLNINNYFPGNNFDIVVSNPPYFKIVESSKLNKNILKRNARHEILINLKQIFAKVDYLLKDHGVFYMVHIPERIQEIISIASNYNLIIKEIQFITTNKGLYPILVLFKFVRNANIGCKVFKEINIDKMESYKGIFRKDW